MVPRLPPVLLRLRQQPLVVHLGQLRHRRRRRPRPPRLRGGGRQQRDQHPRDLVHGGPLRRVSLGAEQRQLEDLPHHAHVRAGHRDLRVHRLHDCVIVRPRQNLPRKQEEEDDEEEDEDHETERGREGD